MYTDKQIEDFIESQDNFARDEWYATHREITETIMAQFKEFCNPPEYQMLYKNKRTGMYFVSTRKYATNAEFYADYDESVIAIRFLKNEM